MSYQGEYQPWSDTRVYTCVPDAGKSSRCPMRLHRLMARAVVLRPGRPRGLDVPKGHHGPVVEDRSAGNREVNIVDGCPDAPFSTRDLVVDENGRPKHAEHDKSAGNHNA